MSQDERNERLMELFAEGAALEPGERAAFIERVGGEDAELRRELEELLEADSDGLDGFLTSPVAQVPPSAGPPLEGQPWSVEPPVIDGYQDLSLIGEGGMGLVFRADQVEPVRRTVAIKVIRLGQSSPMVQRRFEAERHALARMSHGYVASVLDAGVAADGRPYLVMEHVEGQPIHDFCRVEDLDLEERVELCAKVCDAVEHAHSRGVLHRDLKPTNILVLRQNGGPIPKVIDFGIAKSILGDPSEKTLVTRTGAFLGTPEYMSPEQLDGGSRGVDTRADIYALGVLLYEILTGVLPFDSDRLRSAGFADMVSILRHEVPKRPSTRMKTLSSRPRTMSDAGSSPTRWTQRIKGELDWIVMRALEKEPAERYATAGDLAEDLRRFLSHRPIAAGPPSGLHQMRRLTRRYRVQVIAGLLVLVSLLVGLAGTLWFLFDSLENERVARQRTESEAEARLMEQGSRIAAHAALAVEEDPNLALLLALEAAKVSDGATVAAAIYRALPQHDLLMSRSLRGYKVRDLVFLGDGSLVAQTDDHFLWRIDSATGETIQRFDGHTDRVLRMDVDEERGRLLSISIDGTARVFDLWTGEPLVELDSGEAPRICGFSPNGEWFAVLGESGPVRLYDTRTFEQVQAFDLDRGGPFDFEFHPAGLAMLVAARDGGGEIRNMQTGALVNEVAPQDDPKTARESTVWFSPDGSRILRLVSFPISDFFIQILTPTGELIAEFERHSAIKGIPTKPFLLARGERVIEVDVETGEVVREMQTDPISRLVGVDPRGETFVAVDDERDIALFDLATGARLRTFAGRSDKFWRLRAVYHPTERSVAVTGSNVRTWSLDAEYAAVQLPVVRDEARTHRPVSMKYGAEGAVAIMLESGGSERDIWTLWDATRGRMIRELPAEGNLKLQLSPSAKFLLGDERLPRQPDGRWSVRFVLMDLEGRPLASREMETDDSMYRYGWNGTFYFLSERLGEGRVRLRVNRFDTGASVVDIETPTCDFRFRGTEEQPFGAACYGPTSRTDFHDLLTGEMVQSIRGPAGASQWNEALDPVERRVLISQGNLRLRAYDLEGASSEPTGEYTQMVRSDQYPPGFVPGSDLAWVVCTNELHLFDAITTEPFSILRLESDILAVLPQRDGEALYTVTRAGRVQRWPMDPVGVARQMAVGELDGAELQSFDVGTPAEQEARERKRLRRIGSPWSMSKLATRMLEEGDLDGAIDALGQGLAAETVSVSDRRYAVRHVELLARRLSSPDSMTSKEEHLESTARSIKLCLDLGVPLRELRALPGVEALQGEPALGHLLGQ